MTRSRVLAIVVVAIALAITVGWIATGRQPFPADRTPEGAYARIVLAVTEDRPRDTFAYLETDAQWASYAIRDARKRACDRVRSSYPEAERERLLVAWSAEAEAPDGADVVVLIAKQRGWLARLKRDLSGIARVEIDGERATVVTSRGTRYPFRRRDNGIWGLTTFTADLVAESERASRDLAVVQAAADDYDRARP
jgi:hypothetical protein